VARAGTAPVGIDYYLARSSPPPTG